MKNLSHEVCPQRLIILQQRTNLTFVNHHPRIISLPQRYNEIESLKTLLINDVLRG